MHQTRTGVYQELSEKLSVIRIVAIHTGISGIESIQTTNFILTIQNTSARENRFLLRAQGGTIHIRKYAQLSPKGRAYLYRAQLNGEELPVTWHDAAQLEQAIRTLLDQTKSRKL